MFGCWLWCYIVASVFGWLLGCYTVARVLGTIEHNKQATSVCMYHHIAVMTS